MESIYYAFFCLEARVKKEDLSLQVVDVNHQIRDKVLEHLNTHFPPELFVRTETYDTYVFSYRGDLPAKPILELRKQFYSAYDITIADLDRYQEEKISKELSNADVKTLVSYCQSFYYLVSGSYNYFKWFRAEKYYDAGTSPVSNTVDMDCSGILLYLSEDRFDAELSRTVPLLKKALLKLIGDTPLSRLLSFEIFNIKDCY